MEYFAPLATFVKDYQTIIAGVLAAVAALTAIIAAREAVKGQLAVLRLQSEAEVKRRKEHELEEKRSAGLLIWAEVRVVRVGAMEWKAKYQSRRENEKSGNCETGDPVLVPRPTVMFRANVLRLAGFSDELIQHIQVFYAGLGVYEKFLDKPRKPSQESEEEALDILYDAEELEERAKRLSKAIYNEIFEGKEEPPLPKLYSHPRAPKYLHLLETHERPMPKAG